MTVDSRRARARIEEAERLTEAFSRFRSPVTNDPVDPSRVMEVLRYLNAVAAMKEPQKELEQFLKAMPGSYLSKMSKSAGPQLEEVRARIAPLLHKGYSIEDLSKILGWTVRLLQNEERHGRSREDDRRGGRW